MKRKSCYSNIKNYDTCGAVVTINAPYLAETNPAVFDPILSNLVPHQPPYPANPSSSTYHKFALLKNLGCNNK